MITQTFDLNLIPEQAPVVVHCDQYDEGTGRLIINLFEGDVAYTPTGTATIQGRKPDGHGFQYSATLAGNTVTADLTFQMSCVSGRVRCQVVVTESTGRTGTFAFILEVQPSALPSDTDLSDSDYQLIEQGIQAAEDALEAAEDAEAWAVGERGGVPVDPSDETYHNNSYYWAGQAAIYAQGALHFQGSIPFASIPTTGQVGGDMYNITDDFTTDARFMEGAGKFCPAGTNIAWVAASSKWDVLSIMKIGSLDDLTDVSITSPLSGDDYIGYDPIAQEFKNKKLTEMSNLTKGIGRPDGKTTDVSSGVFSAIGVNIPAEVNSGGTPYGANWLYYAGTTEVITPDADQNYRVTDNGTTKLYFWNGSTYEELTSGGGGGGMNTDGSNADSAVAFPSDSISSGKYAKSTGGFAFCDEMATTNELTNNLATIPANTTTETRILNYSLSSYPVQFYWLESSDKVTATAAMTSDITKSFANSTIRVHKENDYIEVWATNTTATSSYIRYARQEYTKADHDSIAIGKSNTASGKDSVALGMRNTANGDYSFAEGFATRAVAAQAHSEGFSTTASGVGAHAEGSNCVASGNYSHAEGDFTLASSQYQVVVGKNNVEDNQDTYAVIVGNGANASNRANAASLDWSGNLEVAGDVTAGNGLSVENIGEGLASINTTGATNTTGSTINAGTYFYLDGVLVRAKADITNGATFTLNTNYEVETDGALNGLLKWKYHNQATGSVAIILPATFNELFVKVVGTVSGITRVYNFHFIYDALSNTMSNTEYYNQGFGYQSTKCFASLYCGKDKVQLNDFVERDSVIVSTAVTTVYYR